MADVQTPPYFHHCRQCLPGCRCRLERPTMYDRLLERAVSVVPVKTSLSHPKEMLKFQVLSPVAQASMACFRQLPSFKYITYH